MALSVIHLIEGYTKEQKAELIRRTNEAIITGMGVHSYCRINEIRLEDCDERTRHMVNLFVYTTEGKTPAAKDRVCLEFENACKAALGEDFGYTIVIFKEHSDENAGSRGHLRPFKN